MVNLIDFFRKEEPKNIIYDSCCNNCLNGEREYYTDGSTPTGVKCLLNMENKNTFDYLCEFYSKDGEFIAYNKSLENNM